MISPRLPVSAQMMVATSATTKIPMTTTKTNGDATPAMAWLATGEELTSEYRELATNSSLVLDTKEAAESLKATSYEWPGPEGFWRSSKSSGELADDP
jgi:hypothetical protein